MIIDWNGAIKKLAGSEISEIRPKACALIHIVKIRALTDIRQNSFSTPTAVFRASSLIFGKSFPITRRAVLQSDS